MSKRRADRRSDTTIGAAVAELVALGIDYKIVINKHAKIRFYVRGIRCTYVVPMSTSDDNRAVKNCRAGIRRLLRQRGLKP